MKNNLIEATYDTYLNRYEESLRNNKVNEKSLAQRLSVLRIFLRFLCTFPDKPDFSDIIRPHIQLFLEYSEREGKSARNLNKYFSFLKMFFMFYKKENVNTNNIFDHWTYKKESKEKSIILSTAEIIDFYNIVKSENKLPFPSRIEIAFLILTYTGCTKSELCELNIYEKQENITETNVMNYILLENKKIYFRKKGHNGTIKMREMNLPDSLVEKIIKYLEYMKMHKGADFKKYPFLFASKYSHDTGVYSKLTSNGITEDIKSIVNKSQVIKNKKVSFQAFRNTFVKNMIDNKVPLQTIKEITGQDISAFKRFMDIEEYEKKQIEDVLKNRHPFKTIIDSI